MISVSESNVPSAEFVLAGQSNAYAFGLPTVPKDSLPQIVSISENMNGLVGGWPRDDAYWHALAEEGFNKTILLSWFGNDPVGRYIFQGKPAFDFILNSAPNLPLDESAQIVPETLIRDTFSVHARLLRELLQSLKSRAKRVILICPPPPKGTSEDALAMMRKETHFAKLAGGDFSGLTIVRDELLVKLWKLLRDMQMESAAYAGVEFADLPTKFLNDQGLLRRDYWANDFSHANKRYGQEFLEDILSEK